jgi:hypothetical protein
LLLNVFDELGILLLVLVCPIRYIPQVALKKRHLIGSKGSKTTKAIPHFDVPVPLSTATVPHDRESQDTVEASMTEAQLRRASVARHKRLAAEADIDTAREMAATKLARATAVQVASEGTRVEPSQLPEYCSRSNKMRHSNGRAPHPGNFLAAVTLFRIKKDGGKSERSTMEMAQWLEYLHYSGVQHVYMYDNCGGGLQPHLCTSAHEAQRDAFQDYIDSGYVTYIDWSVMTPYYGGGQISAYNHVVQEYGQRGHFKWLVVLDEDEWPAAPDTPDCEAGWLSRIIPRITSKWEKPNKNEDKVGEISIVNMVFAGWPDSKEEMYPIRSRGRLYASGQQHVGFARLRKAIINANGVAQMDIHQHHLKRGYIRASVRQNELRSNHLWHARPWMYDQLQFQQQPLSPQMKGSSGRAGDFISMALQNDTVLAWQTMTCLARKIQSCVVYPNAGIYLPERRFGPTQKDIPPERRAKDHPMWD